MTEEGKEPADDFRSGDLTTEEFDDWPAEILQEFKNNEFNGSIGTNLLFENDSVRVWHMELKPGERMPAHRHVLTYFWTALTPGRFLQRTHDGTTYESDYPAGETHFYDVGKGEFALHNLENIGDTTMVFVAVELKKEAHNDPLPVEPGEQYEETSYVPGGSENGNGGQSGFREEADTAKNAFRKEFEERRRVFRQGIRR